ncbi:PPC domain-containing protein [Gemmatimonadota bacterium]
MEMIRAFEATTTGIFRVGNIETGALQTDRALPFPTQLQAGSEYIVIGFCDADCGDLDLFLLDPSGNEIQSDVLPDKEPVLAFTAEATGRYQVRVDMVACSAEPCGFGVAVYTGSWGEGASPGDMDSRLAAFRTEFGADGYVEMQDQEAGSMDEGQEMRFPISLQGGFEYHLVGVCDNDCGDFDLVLYDADGNEVVADLLTDAIPVVSFAPIATAEFRIGATMVTCSVEPCAFRIVPFAKGAGIGPGGVMVHGTIITDATHQGTLQSGDEQLREGEYFDEYSIQAGPGQIIIADLRSDDFDTYLILESPGGTSERNDDFREDTGHSHIEMAAAEGGTFSVVVTSFSSEATGDYILRLMVVEGV